MLSFTEALPWTTRDTVQETADLRATPATLANELRDRGVNEGRLIVHDHGRPGGQDLQFESGHR